MKENEYLELIEAVVKKGPYNDSWSSLCHHEVPKWYKKSKFGIFIVWGIYTVPAYGNEWYARQMYLEGTDIYEYHKKMYGSQKEFGYKDFVPMFKGKKFNAKELMKQFKESGAKYIQPIAIFHDGFPMYNSELNNFNCKNNGPKIDFLGEMKKAAEDEDIVFCASSHYAENYWFYNGGKKFDSDVLDEGNSYLYGPAMLKDEIPKDPDIMKHYIRAVGPDKKFLEKWLAQTCEFVDKYQPKVVFFDWWIQNLEFKPYLKKFAAYYYNRAVEWNQEVTITYKHNAYAYNSAVYDIERGQLSDIEPNYWQCDTSIAKNSWCYTENNDFKKANDIICDLIDIVSKNGNMLLNVGPKEDGTICKEEQEILKNIGKWMNINGEGIYNTTHWTTFGEGPTQIESGYFTDTKRSQFTSQDIRYTYKDGYIYAFVLGKPKEDKVIFKKLNFPLTGDELELGKIQLLGSDDEILYSRDEYGLNIKFLKPVDEDYYPICFKIETI